MMSVVLAITAFLADTLVTLVGADSNGLFDRFLSIFDGNFDSSNTERGRLIAYTVEVATDNALYGLGAGNFGTALMTSGYQDISAALHPENLLLHLLVEFGAIVALSLVALLLYVLRASFRGNETTSRFASAGLISMVFWQQFNSELYSVLLWFTLGILSGLSLAALGRQTGLRPQAVGAGNLQTAATMQQDP